MSLLPRSQNPARRYLVWLLRCSVFLAPTGWIWFLSQTRNVFHLEQYSGQDCLLILLSAAVSMVCNLLAWVLTRKKPQGRWGWLFPAIVFLLTALGWFLALGNGWSRWQSALSAKRITTGQFLRLWLSAAAGAVGALVPLVVLLWPERRT